MNFEIRKGAQYVDIDAVTELLHTTYWAKNRSRETIQKTIENSDCFSVFYTDTGRQVGFARLVTDHVTMYYLCDVVIAPDMRGQGLGTALIKRISEDEAYAGMRALLITQDAQWLYEQAGYKIVDRTVMYK